MLLLNNPFFEVDNIVNALIKDVIPGEKTPLEKLQGKLKANYFNRALSHEQILIELESPRFNEFPLLKHVLQHIFSDYNYFDIPYEIDTLLPIISFESLDSKYGYFATIENKDNLSITYQKLAQNCYKMTRLIEQQAHDPEMAYKLMVLFFDPNKSSEQNFNLIAQAFRKLIKTKQDVTIQNPYHDAFVTCLSRLPLFSDVQNFPGWQAFIKEQGFKALKIFSECNSIGEPPHDINEAKTILLKRKYPRAQENIMLAELCKKLLISNDGFNLGLEYIQSGWPKKESDNLPIVDIQDNTGKFFLIKLPPQDLVALYLGNLIPGCCQHIGGDSEECVKDGVSLSDNGFYVILKSKRKNNSPRLINNQINDKDYEIVAQSYAWLSKNNNLCLDSIEWNDSRINLPTINDLLQKFSREILQKNNKIKYITVGTRGQTPKALFKITCSIPEIMNQGLSYGDSRYQYMLASSLEQSTKQQLEERLKSLPETYNEFKTLILYLAPYFEDIEQIPENIFRVNPEIHVKLNNIIHKLYSLIFKLKIPSRLEVNDFRNLSFDDYQKMDIQQQNNISTFCKILNSSTTEEKLKWLSTIPDDELYSILDTWDSKEVKNEIFKRLPEQDFLMAINQKDRRTSNLLMTEFRDSKTFRIILERLNQEQIAYFLKQKNNFGETATHWLTNNISALEMALSFLTPEQRLDVLQQKEKSQRTIMHVLVNHPNGLEMALNLLNPDQVYTAINHKDEFGASVLHEASCLNIQSLQILSAIYPSEHYINDINNTDNCNKTVMHYAAGSQGDIYHSEDEDSDNEDSDNEDSVDEESSKPINGPDPLELLLASYPIEQRLNALLKVDDSNHTVVDYASQKPYKLPMIIYLLPIKDKFELLKAINKNNISYFELLTTEIDLFNSILPTLPLELSLAIQARNHDLIQSPRDVLESTISIEECLIELGKSFGQEKAKSFVLSLVQFKNISNEIDNLLNTTPSNTFFQADLNQELFKCLKKLHPFWFEPIKPYLLTVIKAPPKI